MSFGIKLGRAVGVVGALAVEGAVRGATGLGQFGADVVTGAEQGYAERHAELLITRAQGEERRKALLAAKLAEHSQAMKVAPEVTPVVPATTRKVRA